MEAASRNLLSFISMLPTCFILGLWDVESDNDGQQEGCVLRVYVHVAFSKKTVWKEWQHLKAESANMLKTVEDLEVSRRYWSFYKIQPPTKIYIGVKI
ncbi:hypothetical protein ES332_D13G100200v1 [Gossypium tomentosum]|uniref:Uncharacterized protein n=1 Tax=Gossypium tomentosum TaxID=34277 RepID=A0A5D2HVC6_GOSTO|nr:hypothetical protein ES332_D13G100200v1 [Gossypium tomentosum]